MNFWNWHFHPSENIETSEVPSTHSIALMKIYKLL